MLSILQKEVDRPLDMKKLQDIMPSFVRVTRYDTMKNFKTLQQALGKNKSVLVVLWNLHDKKHRVLDKPGHFFVISTRGPEPCVVFSSTGMTPKKELFLTQSDPGLLERILPKGTVYNNVKLQIGNSSQTCWRYALIFAHLAPMGLKKFQSLFSRPNLHISNSDMLATIMTFPLLF